MVEVENLDSFKKNVLKQSKKFENVLIKSNAKLKDEDLDDIYSENSSVLNELSNSNSDYIDNFGNH